MAKTAEKTRPRGRHGEVNRMIKLTRLNGEPIIINSGQIMIIDSIPESKIVFMNKEFYIVKESPEEIIEKIADFHRRILNGQPVQTERAMGLEPVYQEDRDT
ncbi:MAG: flagellar FlbD family protein [Anaerovoracaceae bacterium]